MIPFYDAQLQLEGSILDVYDTCNDVEPVRVDYMLGK